MMLASDSLHGLGRMRLLVGVLPGVNTQQGLELSDNGVLVLWKS